MKRYTFVDFATQGYIALVAVLILFSMVTGCQFWLLLVHVAGFGLIHCMIRLCAKLPGNSRSICCVTKTEEPATVPMRRFVIAIKYAGDSATPRSLRWAIHI